MATSVITVTIKATGEELLMLEHEHDPDSEELGSSEWSGSQSELFEEFLEKTTPLSLIHQIPPRKHDFKSLPYVYALADLFASQNGWIAALVSAVEDSVYYLNRSDLRVGELL